MKSVFRLRRLWLLLTFPASFFLLFLASRWEGFAETYATTVYPALSLFGNHVTGIAPFSIGEALVYLLAVLFLFAAVRFTVRLIRGKGRRGNIAGRFFVNLFCLAGVLLFSFTVNCGINYHRSTFAETSGLTVKESSEAELVSLCKSLAADSNRLRQEVKTDGNSVMELRADGYGRVAEEARTAYDRLQPDYPLLRAGYSAPKPVASSRLMSKFNITGIFFPFTFEANVNTDVPEYTIPFTMCHELTHLRGFMREDEANFAAYLACEKSADADFQYSGAAMAFTYASNALFAADAKTAGTVYAALSDGVRRDLRFNSEYWDKFKGPAAEVSQKANNSYLKANAQPDGVQSYGRMVDLLLALQRARSAK